MSEKKNNSLLNEEEEAQVNGGLIAEASAAVPAEDLAAPALGKPYGGDPCAMFGTVLRTIKEHPSGSESSKND